MCGQAPDTWHVGIGILWNCSNTGSELGTHLFGAVLEPPFMVDWCSCTCYTSRFVHAWAPWLFHVSMPYVWMPCVSVDMRSWHESWFTFTSVFLLAWNENSMEIGDPAMTCLKSLVSICLVRPSASMVFVSHHRTFVVPSAGTDSFIIGSPNSSPFSRQMIWRIPQRSIAKRLSWTSPPEHCTRWSCNERQSVTLWSLIASFDSVCHAWDLGSWGVRSPCRTSPVVPVIFFLGVQYEK